jgi:hypothetical protein
MRPNLASIALASVLVVSAATTLAQPMMGPGGGYMHGTGAGMMGRGWGYADPGGYLGDLKLVLGITEAQEAAWAAYTAVVKDAATQMQGAHQTMYQAMGTASWEERRDMMNRMFEVRQQTFDAVHTAAEKLLPALDDAQEAKAATRLPGLAGPAYGMMGQGPRWR